MITWPFGHFLNLYIVCRLVLVSDSFEYSIFFFFLALLLIGDDSAKRLRQEARVVVDPFLVLGAQNPFIRPFVHTFIHSFIYVLMCLSLRALNNRPGVCGRQRCDE